MKKDLTFEEAKTLALKLINAAFTKKKFILIGGLPAPTVKFDDILGGKKGNRWEFKRTDAIAGPWATVSFYLNGSSPKVKIGYSPQ